MNKNAVKIMVEIASAAIPAVVSVFIEKNKKQEEIDAIADAVAERLKKA